MGSRCATDTSRSVSSAHATGQGVDEVPSGVGAVPRWGAKRIFAQIADRCVAPCVALAILVIARARQSLAWQEPNRGTHDFRELQGSQLFCKAICVISVLKTHRATKQTSKEAFPRVKRTLTPATCRHSCEQGKMYTYRAVSGQKIDVVHSTRSETVGRQPGRAITVNIALAAS